MFRTFGEITQQIEEFYNNKEYHRVVIESAKLTEKALGFIFLNFHRTLDDEQSRKKYLEFEKENEEKYYSFLKKPNS